MVAGKRKRVYDPAKRRAAYLRAKQKAQAAGYSSPSTMRRWLQRESLFPGATKRAILAKHNVSEAVFNRMREDNLAHTPEGFRKDGYPLTSLAWSIQKYNTEVDADENNWSDERVGYIVSYYWAVTSPATNYFSMKGNLFVNQNAPSPDFLKWKERQYTYLVRYGGLSTQGELMTADDFEDRYGVGGPISQDLIAMYKLDV